MSRLDNRYVIATVAIGAAALTVHGSAYAAELAGVPAPWSYLYPAIGDGLAVAAWRATSAPEQWRRIVARLAMFSAAAASGLAQGYALATSDPSRPAPLAWGMGIAPALVVLIVAILGAGRDSAGSDIPANSIPADVASEPVEPPAPTDPWPEWSEPAAPPTGDTAAEATRDTTPARDTTPLAKATPARDTEGDTRGDTTPGGDTAAAGPRDTPARRQATPSRDTSDSPAAARRPEPGEDPVAWLLAERAEGRDHSGAAVGRAFDRNPRWGQRTVQAADKRAQTQPPRIHAVK